MTTDRFRTKAYGEIRHGIVLARCAIKLWSDGWTDTMRDYAKWLRGDTRRAYERVIQKHLGDD